MYRLLVTVGRVRLWLCVLSTPLFLIARFGAHWPPGLCTTGFRPEILRRIGKQISLPQRVDRQLCLSDRETCQDGTRVMHHDFIFLLVCGVKKRLVYLHSLKTHIQLQ